MLDFLFIILIFLEIAFLYFAIGKILKLNKKINELNKIIIEKGEIIKQMHKKIQKIIKKVNFFVSIVTNKKLWQIKRIISIIISTIEIIIILRSFNYEKGVKFNLKNLKKLLLTGLGKRVVKNLFNTVALVC